jgi:antitoxin PrlF
MPNMLAAESTLTDRYQTTVPESVRRALKLGKRDKIQYTLRSNGEVVLTRADAAQNADPLLSQFLGFLAQDIAAHPEHLQGLSTDLANRVHPLVAGVDVDLNTPLSADDE